LEYRCLTLSRKLI